MRRLRSGLGDKIGEDGQERSFQDALVGVLNFFRIVVVTSTTHLVVINNTFVSPYSSVG